MNLRYWTELKIGNIVAIDSNGQNWETCLFGGESQSPEFTYLL